MSINVAIRVDASIKIGSGHFMRCMNLAMALRARNVRVSFICREHEGNLIHLLHQYDMPVTVLPAPPLNHSSLLEDYKSWLGVSQEEDAAQTLEAFREESVDWLIVDHYALDEIWEKKLRPHVAKLMVIDDLANRSHECDILLDQNYSGGGERRYADLVPGSCKILLGPHYAMLRHEYAQLRKKIGLRDVKIKRVLIFFGGTDPLNMTGLALTALNHPSLQHLEVDVVLGANNKHCGEIEQQISQRNLTTLYGPQPHLADLMKRADLAIGAGGVTTWERMCLGLPTIIITIAENQVPLSKALGKEQLANYLGCSTKVTSQDISQCVLKMMTEEVAVGVMSLRSRVEVDGFGADRVSEILLPTPENGLKLRVADKNDVLLYYHWVNDPEVRKNSIQSRPVLWDVHQEWFRNKINDSDSQLFVCETVVGVPIGQIRFDKEADGVSINYSIDPSMRGRGLGAILVSHGMKLFRRKGAIKFYAKVKEENKPSQRIFLNLGFTVCKCEEGFIFFSYDLAS